MKLNSENLNINLRHLQALQAIAREGTFAAAASSLGIVPSALTEVVAQLERAIGAPLFDRTTRPASMTPLARDFLADTAPLVDGMDRAVTRLRQRAGLEVGRLAIGAAPSAISELIAPVLAGFLGRYPGIHCTLHDDIAERLAQMVADGQLDVAIAGRARQTPDLAQREILRDPFVLACHADDPLMRAGDVALADLDADRMIGVDPATGTYRLLKSCADIPRSFLDGRLRAHSTIAQLCMIRAGLGIALLPRNAVTLFRDPQITFRPVRDLDLWRVLYLLQPARRSLSGAARAFVDLLDQRSGDRIGQ